MSISQEELYFAYAAESDWLNDQLRSALESSPPPEEDPLRLYEELGDPFDSALNEELEPRSS